MSFQKKIEELDKKIAELEGSEEDPKDDAEDTGDTDDSGQNEDAGGNGDDDGAEDAAGDEGGEADKADDDESGDDQEDKKPDNASMARIRLENKRLQERIDTLERLQKLEKQKPSGGQESRANVDNDPMPDPDEDPVGHLRWEKRQLEKKVDSLAETVTRKEILAQAEAEYEEAKAEFISFETAARTRLSDYEDVSTHAVKAIAQEIRNANPDLPGHLLGKATEREIMRRASLLLNAGIDPAEGLYDMAIKKYGYKAKSEKKEKEVDLSKIKANKQRAATHLGNGGRSGKPARSGNLSSMTNAEKARLTDEEWEELIAAETV